jgi:hypothetical protein
MTVGVRPIPITTNATGYFAIRTGSDRIACRKFE